MKIRLILLLMIMVTIAGCYYDNEEELYGACKVDAASIRYSTTLVNILNANGCTGCHGSTAPSGGITLNTYNGVKTVASNGRLYGAISHAPGFSPMPQGGGKISDCDISKIKAWIDAGAPNN